MLILNNNNGNCDGEAAPRFGPVRNDDGKKRNSTEKRNVWKHTIEKPTNNGACHLLK
jgi:hypothetical protein